MNSARRPYLLPEPLLCSIDKVASGVTMTLIEEYIRKHEQRMPRYIYLENLYKGFHDVYNQPEKPQWKPDNRLAVNFPRYVTDTFLGFTYGIPIKKSHPDEAVNEAINAFERDNEITDHEYELAKKCCIYGHAWEYLYQDEEARTKMVACTPKEVFTVYDDTVQNRALFSVRYGAHENGVTKYGEVMTRDEIIVFDGGKIKERRLNPYGRIPVVEWQLNTERIGLYEEVAGLVEAFNHTIGEKANDVDAFAEAYLAVLGAELDEDGIYKIRDNRIINLYGTDDAKDILVQFLQKPTADGTQENLLDRLEQLIYRTSMVSDISDETFGSATSGTALAFKLLPMSNLAAGFDRKVEKSLRKRYKLFCSLSTNVSDRDAWRDIKIQTSRNLPKNVQEEAQTAAQLEGIVSKETQLSVLSIVSDPRDEIDRMEQEQNRREESVVDRRMFGGVTGGDDQSGVLETERGGTTEEKFNE